MSAVPDLSLAFGPGLVFDLGHIDHPDFSIEQFTKWHGDHHVPWFLKTGYATHAADFVAMDSNPATRGSRADDMLTLYRVAALQDLLPRLQELARGVPSYEELPGGKEGKTIFDYMDVVTAFYVQVSKFQKEGHDSEAFASSITTVGMTPKDAAAAEDTNRWHREDDNRQISSEPGWLRTTRYKLVLQLPASRPNRGAAPLPEWITVHEFGRDKKLGPKVEPLVPRTELTRRVVGSLSIFEAVNWKLTGSWSQ